LLKAGHQVKTTVRAKSKGAELKSVLLNLGVAEKSLERLSVYEVDLSSDIGWQGAINGCDYILHVASPFPLQQPDNEDEVIRPAVEGTLRILKLAKEHSVKRVVLTSSFGAVGYGHGNVSDRVFDENDWTNITSPGMLPYVKSKALAEKAAWEFVSSAGKTSNLELTVIIPTGIFGPVANPQWVSTSMQLVKRVIDGKMINGCPELYFAAVDVRDVAKIHVQAMLLDRAAGERFILSDNGGIHSWIEIAQIAKEITGSKEIATQQLPGDPTKRRPSNKFAKSVFNWEPIPFKVSIEDAVNSLS
jgi:dihydroflavonol-4-reductase